MSRHRASRLVLLAACVAVLNLAGCAITRAPGGTLVREEPQGDNDPWEPVNRKIFAFNKVVDDVVLKPVAKGYRAALPEYVRDRIRAFVNNVHEPLIFANDVLQWRWQAAGTTAGRFIANSVVGIAGFYDVATEWGWMRQSGDFGQTLYTWGLAEGPYLVIPIAGPSNVRDGIGMGVDTYVSPVHFIGSEKTGRTISFSIGIVDGIDLRSRHIESLEQLEAGSLDFYAFLRSVSQQNRRQELRAGVGQKDPDELVDPDATPPAPAK